jgi:hypothetical protein
MNIFYLDTDPKICAQYHHDMHVNKMILETAQLLCFVHYNKGATENIPYKPNERHHKHPCTLWATESLDNYLWLCELGMELSDEHKWRRGNDYYHKSREIIIWAMNHIPNDMDFNGFTTPALAMPEPYKTKNPTFSYKTYYIEDKQYWERKNKKTGEITKIKNTWMKRGAPHWWIDKM